MRKEYFLVIKQKHGYHTYGKNRWNVLNAVVVEAIYEIPARRNESASACIICCGDAS